jgi:hypothetical protein
VASSDESFVDKVSSKWWGKLVMSVVCFVGAYAAWSDFTKLENGDTNFIVGSKLIITTYRLFGKLPTVGVLFGVGLLFLGWGDNQWRTGEE